MLLQINQPAPEFKLFNSEKKEVSLSEQKGRNVVLLFFPFAFSSTCTKELHHIAENFNMYAGLNAVIIGISSDSLFTLAKFKEELKLNFDLLSDYNKETSEAYGSLYPTWNYGMKNVTKRSAFVIDKSGILKYAEVLENAGDLPNFEAIQTTLQNLG